ncbi:MAG: arginine deiminase [Bacteroidales bacterium]|nr:arginine deiminase [Bacteroidales bacterium]MBK7175157.1 arginine deiminase [Bacteroidales bacterium]
MTSKPSNYTVDIRSEIGELEAVILHTPGPEVENMTPASAQKALYSDILNLSVALKEYNQFKGFLSKVTKTLQVKDLLIDILKNDRNKETIIKRICDQERQGVFLQEELMVFKSEKLATVLIEGIEMKKDNLTRFLSKDRYSLEPLHNFFFTRDASVAILDKVLISRMASRIRERESLIMDSIFTMHPLFQAKTIHPEESKHFCKEFSFEGGDFLVAREDILLIGTGPRTTSKGIDFIIEYYRKKNVTRHIIVQELPHNPESFIHLDMVFTFLDRNQCMIYEPLVMHPSRYLTIHISIHNGKVKSIREVENIPSILRELGMDLELLYCGGRKDIVNQEREQWHSGANFFAVGPGKIVGYGRNIHTIEELNQHGYEVLKANDVIHGKVDPGNYNKYIVTIDGAELSRGGGGCRCMTMPIRRRQVDW